MAFFGTGMENKVEIFVNGPHVNCEVIRIAKDYKKEKLPGTERYVYKYMVFENKLTIVHGAKYEVYTPKSH